MTQKCACLLDKMEKSSFHKFKWQIVQFLVNHFYNHRMEMMAKYRLKKELSVVMYVYKTPGVKISVSLLVLLWETDKYSIRWTPCNIYLVFNVVTRPSRFNISIVFLTDIFLLKMFFFKIKRKNFLNVSQTHWPVFKWYINNVGQWSS